MAPPLPQLEGDLILDVFTHHSLTRDFLNEQTPHGNSSRLELLGKSALDTIVSFLLFAERPMLCADDFKIKHAFILSDQSMVVWVNYYDTELKRRVRGVSQNIFDDPKEARFLFNSYVRAVCVQSGLQAAADWISKLVKPDQQPLVLFDTSGNRPMSAHPMQAPNQASPLHAAAPPPYYPGAPQVPLPPPGCPQGFLALLNQTCSQQRLTLDWNICSSGPQHDPRWQAKCLINGGERGSGQGRNQKEAKTAAATEAYQYMQSIGWNVQQPEPTA